MPRDLERGGGESVWRSKTTGRKTHAYRSRNITPTYLSVLPSVRNSEKFRNSGIRNSDQQRVGEDSLARDTANPRSMKRRLACAAGSLLVVLLLCAPEARGQLLAGETVEEGNISMLLVLFVKDTLAWHRRKRNCQTTVSSLVCMMRVALTSKASTAEGWGAARGERNSCA